MLRFATCGHWTALFIFQTLLILAIQPGVSLARNPASPVAAVNGVDISAAEFAAALQQARYPWEASTEGLTDRRLRTLRKEVLENLIGRRLAYQESRRLGIQVDSDLIDREMEKAAARFSTAVEFAGALHRAGLSREHLREQLRQDIAIRLLLEDQVLRDVEVNDRELREFYDSHPNLFKTPALVRASHIFIAAGSDSSRTERKEAVARLRSIQARLDEGIAFAELALDYSQCPSSENGGDLGYFDKEKMIKNFADAAFALHPGEVSDIVRTGSGYHLIMVADRKPKAALTFEEVREKLRRDLKVEKATRDIKAYLQTLRHSAKVNIFLPL